MVTRKKMTTGRRLPKAKTPRPRQPTDLTLRNLRAAKKRLDAIAMELDALQARVTTLEAAQPLPAPEPSQPEPV